MPKFLHTIAMHVLFAMCLVEAFCVGYNWPHPVEPPFIDEQLQPYIDDFETDAAKYNVDIKPETLGMVQFQDLPEHYVGFCNTAGTAWGDMGFVHTNTIVISTKIKDQVGDCYFKAIMYHELGHCLLAKGHDPENSMTIMDPAPFGSNDFWCATWDAQVKDLFTRGEDEPVPNYGLNLDPVAVPQSEENPKP